MAIFLGLVSAGDNASVNFGKHNSVYIHFLRLSQKLINYLQNHFDFKNSPFKLFSTLNLDSKLIYENLVEISDLFSIITILNNSLLNQGWPLRGFRNTP